MMTEREKLIEILSTKIHPREGIDPAEVIADFLLDHDVIPVTRCRGCKWGQPDKLLNKYLCTRVFGCMKVREDDFCSYGRRKEDKP